MNFEPPFTMIICGNSGSGKTQLLKEQDIFVISPSMGFIGDYAEYEEQKKFTDRLYDH